MPFGGTASVRSMAAGAFVATLFPGTDAGVVAALTNAGAGGEVRIGAGNITVTSVWTVPQGCKLRLGPGTYTFEGASQISLSAFAVLKGSGYGCTSLKAGTTFSSGSMVTNADQTGGMQSCSAYEFEINGNKASATVPKGIHFKGIGQVAVIRDVVVFNVSGVGIYLEGISSNAGSGCALDNVWVNASNDHNIVITGPTGAYTLNRVSSESVAAGKAAIFIDGSSGSTVQGGYWLRDIHVEVLPATATGVLISSAHDVIIDGIRYFGAGGTGELVKLTGLAADTFNILVRGAYDRFNALANTINDTVNSVTLQNQVPIYYLANPRFQGNVTISGTEDLTGNLTARGATNNFGTAGVAQTTKVGQGNSGSAQTDFNVESGSSGTTKARAFLSRNGQTDLLFQIDGTLEYLQARHNLQFGTTAGAQTALLTTAGKFRLGTSGTPVGGLEVATGDLVLTRSSLTDAATITVDASLGNIFAVTLGGNRTMGSPSNSHTGARITFEVLQDSTGGRTLGWNAVYKTAWSDTGNTLNKVSTISFVYNGTNWVQDGAQSPYM